MRPKIRRWAVLTAVLYGLTLAGLSLPLVLAAFGSERTGLTRDPDALVDVVGDISEIYTQWQYWACIGGLCLVEAIFLLTPIQVARHRPVKRARWYTLAITAGLMMGLLFFGLSIAVAEALVGNSWGQPFPQLYIALGATVWVFSAIVFARYAYTRNTASAFRRVLDRLIAGSIAELLVAVPCHVYVRHKDYCCAGFGTFIGLATGLAVLFFAFGPGVFFLFVARIKRLRAAALDESGDEIERPPVWLTSRVRHTRQVAFWTAGATVFLTALLLAGLFFKQDFQMLVDGARVSFLLIAGVAGYHAFYAAARREPGWRLAAACGLLLAEIVLVAVLYGWK